MHLTNYSINKLAQSNDQGNPVVLKWKLTSLWQHIAEYVDVKVIQQRIIDVIIKTVIACETPIRKYQKKFSLYSFTCHELFGMDILIDDTLRPWLLEVNISPSLHSETALDFNIKAPLARDVLNLCGVQVPSVKNEKESPLVINYGVKPHDRHKTVHDLEKERFHVEYYNKNRKIDPSIIEKLTGSDVRILIDFEDELLRAGGFTLIFPTVNTIGYLKYFSEPIYSNLLLTQWQIEQCESDRQTGIRSLEEFCKRGDHLSELSDEFTSSLD
ncbi:unnamed protein product [Dracunculus medinensis]|uniref:Tubulin--tyrosine ligase-like protein 9 n=1 Tax=Dracunculus medinensis TaxID=318479 RepID=A0A0N4UKF6_DRAME|nr:unnamed protein product [Dracunculus medinensis]